jgi:hypothetical protein
MVENVSLDGRPNREMAGYVKKELTFILLLWTDELFK